MAMMSDFEHQYKILLIGDVKVGKSTFLTRYITNTVIQEPIPTLGVEYQVKSIILKDGTVVKLQIWDTSGSERYKAITTAHYRKSAGALLFYDITDRITFENLQEWLKEIKNNAEENTVVMLIGNKYDLVANNNSQRQVTTEEAIQFAKKYKLMFAETSAKTGHNLKDSLEALIEAVYEEQKKVQAKYERENSQTLKLKAEKTGSNISENQGGCCG